MLPYMSCTLVGCRVLELRATPPPIITWRRECKGWTRNTAAVNAMSGMLCSLAEDVDWERTSTAENFVNVGLA